MPQEAAGAPELHERRTTIRLRGRPLTLHHTEVRRARAGAPPVILLHGMASSWRQWRRTLLRQGTELPLVALDLPGFGDSELAEQPLDFGDFADACEVWCEAQGWREIAAVGHSFGGAVLIDWAARYPARFRCLGLIAPAAVFHKAYTEDWTFLRWPIIGPLLAPLVIWLVSTRWFGRRTLGRIVAHLRQLDDDLARDMRWGCRRAREMLRALDYYRLPDLHGHLRRIRQPVALGWGIADPVVPFSDAPQYANTLPDCRRLLAWDDCGHVPMIERPEQCDDLILWVAHHARTDDRNDQQA